MAVNITNFSDVFAGDIVYVEWVYNKLKKMLGSSYALGKVVESSNGVIFFKCIVSSDNVVKLGSICALKKDFINSSNNGGLFRFTKFQRLSDKEANIYFV